jgi:LysR family transcriptional regulator (chromosome initiation inhibitor)
MEMCFFDFVEKMDIFNQIILEIIADDQELTLEYMKKGLVSACLSTAKKEIMGGNICYLGKMEYLLVATPPFIEKYFSDHDDKANLVNAPAFKFDKNDHLHERYLEKFFGLRGAELNYNIIPSIKGFKRFAVLGYGYGLIPRIDISEELEQKQLIELYPGKVWETPLYWHYWPIETEVYRKFNAEFIHYMTNKLKS